jgi:hypothetical protein
VTTRVRRTLALAAAALLVAAPDLASACAVCMGGTGGGTLRAFAIGTLFLSLLPLAMIGGMVWWLRRRARAIAREAELRGAAADVPVAHRSAATR